MENKKISKYLSLYEATSYINAVRAGVDNTPTGEFYQNMLDVAVDVFDPCREAMGGPLFCHCLYRGQKYNSLVKGADPNSDHLRAQAIDMDCEQYGNGDNKKLFLFVINNLDYDNIIWEFGNDEKPDWVHVSYKKGRNRKIITRKEKDKPYVRHYDSRMKIEERLKFLGLNG